MVLFIVECVSVVGRNQMKFVVPTKKTTNGTPEGNGPRRDVPKRVDVDGFFLAEGERLGGMSHVLEKKRQQARDSVPKIWAVPKQCQINAMLCPLEILVCTPTRKDLQNKLIHGVIRIRK